TLIAGRVVPFFARSVTPGLRNEVSIGRERALAMSTSLALLAWLLNASPSLTAALLLTAAGLHLWRLHTWQPKAALRRPLLWSLYLAYAWIPVGLVLLALAQWQIGSISPALHAFAVGATAGLILAMMTRTARGHTGRPLTAGRAESAAYILIAVAALLRVGVPLLLPGLYQLGLIAAGLCFAAAFLIYVVVYTPLLTTTRADGRDG
ncbi:short-chain dehydrogenase, partial [Pelomonas sp. HMWF004]